MQTGFDQWRVTAGRYAPPLLARGEPPSDAELARLEQQADREAAPARDDRIFCRQCLQHITSPAERIEVQGAHRHTFSNPAGLLYQIGCYRNARGCTPASGLEAQWSWFRGYRWQVVLCLCCGTHMGWRYKGAGDAFYGLILDRLVERQDG